MKFKVDDVVRVTYKNGYWYIDKVTGIAHGKYLLFTLDAHDDHRGFWSQDIESYDIYAVLDVIYYFNNDLKELLK